LRAIGLVRTIEITADVPGGRHAGWWSSSCFAHRSDCRDAVADQQRSSRRHGPKPGPRPSGAIVDDLLRRADHRACLDAGVGARLTPRNNADGQPWLDGGHPGRGWGLAAVSCKPHPRTPRQRATDGFIEFQKSVVVGLIGDIAPTDPSRRPSRIPVEPLTGELGSCSACMSIDHDRSPTI